MVKKSNVKKTTEELAKELFSLLEVKAEIEVTQEDEALVVNLEAPEATGLLIGRRGETLLALQSFLAAALKQQTGEWWRVVVNVGDWRQKQEEHLTHLADQARQRTLETGQPQYLYNLNPAQRRMVHLFLAKNKDVVTESEGEGSERYLIVRAKKQEE